MHRAQPVASSVCDEKWRDRSYRIHRQKLQKIKPSIDNKPPPMYPHLYQKLKKAQMEEERCSEIERDNRTLVRRMTQIMQRSSLDNKNPVQYKSLNRDHRRRELIRITQENQSLLRRIQTKQPTYNHLQWEQEREKNEALCERICKYPYHLNGPDDFPNDEEGYASYAAQVSSPSEKAKPVVTGDVANADAASDSFRPRAESTSKRSLTPQSQSNSASVSMPISKGTKEDGTDKEEMLSKRSSRPELEASDSYAPDASKASKGDEEDEGDEEPREEDAEEADGSSDKGSNHSVDEDDRKAQSES